MSREVPSQEAMEQAFEDMGLADAPDKVLQDDNTAIAQYRLAVEIDTQNNDQGATILPFTPKK